MHPENRLVLAYTQTVHELEHTLLSEQEEGRQAHSIHTTPSNHHLVNKFNTRIVYDGHALAYTQTVMNLEHTSLSAQNPKAAGAFNTYNTFKPSSCE
jgi:hypothetical protein